jgi:hypothetical protein
MLLAFLPRITFHFKQLTESIIGISRIERDKYSQSIRAKFFSNSFPCTKENRIEKNTQLINILTAVI